jgi:hypothetical protein
MARSAIGVALPGEDLHVPEQGRGTPGPSRLRRRTCAPCGRRARTAGEVPRGAHHSFRYRPSTGKTDSERAVAVSDHR